MTKLQTYIMQIAQCIHLGSIASPIWWYDLYHIDDYECKMPVISNHLHVEYLTCWPLGDVSVPLNSTYGNHYEMALG